MNLAQLLFRALFEIWRKGNKNPGEILIVHSKEPKGNDIAVSIYDIVLHDASLLSLANLLLAFSPLLADKLSANSRSVCSENHRLSAVMKMCVRGAPSALMCCNNSVDLPTPRGPKIPISLLSQLILS